MKSIDRLNNAVIKGGKKIANSDTGKKVVNSKAGNAIKGAIESAANNSKFIGNVTGINQANMQKALQSRINDSVRMTSNPTFKAYDTVVKRDLSKLQQAKVKAVKNNKSLSKLEKKIADLSSSGASQDKINKVTSKFNGKLDKMVANETKNYLTSKAQFEATPEFKTYSKILEDKNNLSNAYNKAMRDTRNSRRALTGGIIIGGAGLPIVVNKINEDKQRQEALNRARMSYYL